MAGHRDNVGGVVKLTDQGLEVPLSAISFVEYVVDAEDPGLELVVRQFDP